MTIRKILAIGALTGILPLTLAAQTAAPQKPSIFHDTVNNLTVSIPVGFKVEEQKTVQAAIDQETEKQPDTAHKAVASCISLPFTSSRESDGFALMLQMTFSGSCVGADLAPANLANFTTSSFNGSLTNIGSNAKMDAPQSFDFNGHPAQVVFGTVDAKGETGMAVPLYGATICTQLGNNYVCWEIVTSLKPELPLLLQSQITLADGKPFPLLPADLVPKP